MRTFYLALIGFIFSTQQLSMPKTLFVQRHWVRFPRISRKGGTMSVLTGSILRSTSRAEADE